MQSHAEHAPTGALIHTHRQAVTGQAITGSRLIGAAIIALALLLAATAPAQASGAGSLLRRCFAFEDLTLGTHYPNGSNFITDSLPVTVADFVSSNGTPTSGGFIEVENGGLAGGSGNELEVNNADFKVTLPQPIVGFSFRFGEYGGNVNLVVNGDLANTDDFVDLDGATLGGALVTVITRPGGERGLVIVHGPVSDFAIGGQELWIDNLCLFDRDESEPDPEQGRPDLGDAPDSTNHHAVINTAYTAGAVAGNYPTIWENPGNPSGPLHRNPRFEGILGNLLSAEREADQGADADGINNILTGGADLANDDLADDGWRNRRVPIENCRQTTLRVRVSRGPAATLERMYLNVWFDGNRDGDWQDFGECSRPDETATARSYEWIVQDFAVNIGAIPLGGFVDINVPTELVYNTTEGMPHWLRFSLSETPAVRPAAGGPADGRGPQFNAPQTKFFSFGETEDYFQRPLPKGDPGTLEIEKRVETGSDPVRPGDVVTYVVTLEHVGGEGPARTVVSDALPSGVRMAGPVRVVDAADYVIWRSLQVNRHGFSWQGTLSPNGRIAFAFPVQVARCYGDQTRGIVNRAVALQTNGERIHDEAAFEVQCLSLDVSSVVVTPTLELVDREPGELSDETIGNEANGDDPGVFPGQRFRLRTQVSNLGLEPLSLSLNFEEIKLGWYGCLTCTVRTEAARDIKDGTSNTLLLKPGETRTIYSSIYSAQLEFGGTGVGNPGSSNLSEEDEIGDFEREGEIAIVYCLADGEQGCPNPDEQPTLSQVQHIRFRIWRRDAGDAPDSSNHFGVPMTAYAAGPVAGRYPTVFDPATAPGGLPPQGPIHLRARPFHLGDLVSWEAGVDIGPDQDFVNNLEPLVDQANLDRYDDGANPPVWTLQHCRATSVLVRVFISPLAVAYLTQNHDGVGYLNGWIDGNRDGDWEDARECEQDGEQDRYAIEHIIRDYRIDAAALGSGLHTIQVPTGLVPWPADMSERPAWVRLTLSERESNKTYTVGSIAYGDGRGYARPFRTGETEDYLYRPANNPGGVDLTIRKAGRVYQHFDLETETVQSRIAWTIEYRNRGDRTAENVRIVDTMSDVPNIIAILIGLFNEPDAAYEVDGNQITFDIGDVGPGESGRIVIVLKVEQSMLELNIIRNRAEISGDGDVDTSNNVAEAAVEIGVRAPRIQTPVDGSTCSNDVTIQGVAEHGALVEVYVDGEKHGETTANDSGRWSYSLLLNDGMHTIYATATLGDVTGPPSAEIDLLVDSTLAWDPISLRFIGPRGHAQRPVDENGRTDAEGWSLNLRPNTTYTASVRICCDDPNAQVTLTIDGDPAIEVALTDPDGDGIFEGVFTTGARDDKPASMSITVVCGDVTSTGEGSVVLIDPAGTVFDVLTDAELADATVACLVEDTISGDTSLWDAATYGQINPQITDDDGYFSFFTPPGSYQLDVNRSGYQPYRSPSLEVIADPVYYDIPLTPNIADEADHTVQIGAAGFEPAILVVAPGAVIEWVNVDESNHSTTSFDTNGPEANGIMWDSGMLATGESYKFRLNTEGTFSVTDRANPANSATILVVAAEDLENPIFLPFIASEPGE